MKWEEAVAELREAMLEPVYVLDSMDFDKHVANGGQGEPEIVLPHVTGAALLLEYDRLRRIEEAAREVIHGLEASMTEALEALPLNASDVHRILAAVTLESQNE